MYKSKFNIGDRLWCGIKVCGSVNTFLVQVTRIMYMKSIHEPPVYYCKGVCGELIEDEEIVLNEEDLFLSENEARKNARSRKE